MLRERKVSTDCVIPDRRHRYWRTCYKDSRSQWLIVRMNEDTHIQLLQLYMDRTVFCFGEALTRTGGIVSKGPPVGAPLLAHCERNKSATKPKARRKEMSFIGNKITTYSLYILQPRVTILNFDPGVSKRVWPQLCNVAPVVMISSTNNQWGI